MYESRCIIEKVRPALADELLKEGADRRGPQELLSEASALVQAALSPGGEPGVGYDEAKLCSAAALLLALCQPHAPSAATGEEADYLTYALRVSCFIERSSRSDNSTVHVVGAMNAVQRALDDVGRALSELQLRPDSDVASSELLGACLSGATSCIETADAIQRIEGGISGFVARDDLEIDAAAERVIAMFGELQREDRDKAVRLAGDSDEARAAFGPGVAWRGGKDLKAFLEAFSHLSDGQKDMAVRGCAWMESDRKEVEAAADLGMAEGSRLPWFGLRGQDDRRVGTAENAVAQAPDDLDE